MVQINQQYLKLNKNLPLSFVFSAAVSALVAQLLSSQESHLNTTYTIIAGYATFFLIFGMLFYQDSKKRYQLIGKTNKDLLKKEIIRLVSSLGIAELVYIAIRWFLQYYLLTINYEPYLASLTSEVISTAIYMLVVSINLKITGMFKTDITNQQKF